MGSAHAETPALHEIGLEVASLLGLSSKELATLAPLGTPHWSSNLRVGELAADSVAHSTLAITLIAADRAHTRPSAASVTVDPERVAASFGSEKLFRVDNLAPTIWAPLSGFWRVSDGWVRTHGNYPHHAERLAAILGITEGASKPEIETVLRAWNRFDLEERAAARGALAVAVRSVEEWRQHPQYEVLAEDPILHFTQHPQAEPRPWSEHAELPLSGVRVLDLTRVIAGPVATRDLAWAGADVLRIDSPRLPEPKWQHFDTGQEKRTSLLDLAEPGGFARLNELLENADVVVHGYRPTALARYGLDADSLHERFPGLIVAQLSAWGTRGPWGARRGFDSLVQAATGISFLESTDEGATPGALPVQGLDHSAGHFIAAAVATALRAQRNFGGSYAINISLARIAHALIDSGPAKPGAGAFREPPNLTVSVPVRAEGGEPTPTVTCAPPPLQYPDASSSYRSPLHRWGSDEAVWLT